MTPTTPGTLRASDSAHVRSYGRSTTPDIVTQPFSTSTSNRWRGTAKSQCSAFSTITWTSAPCDMIIIFLLTSTRRARLREADHSLLRVTLTLDCLPRDADAVAR